MVGEAPRIAIRLWLVLLLAATVVAGDPLPASAAGRAHFLGPGNDWFDPSNWNTGQVPDTRTDVILDGADDVVINPARGPEVVAIRDLQLRDRSRLTTLPGTDLRTRKETVLDAAQLVHRSSQISGNRTVVNGGTLVLNPSTQSHRDVILHTSISAEGTNAPTAVFGISGTAPASPGDVGPGHYATVNARRVRLDGNLELQLLPGFTPAEGDEFVLVRADRLAGEFDGLPDGAMVQAIDEDLGFFINYAEEPRAAGTSLPKFKITVTIRGRPKGG